jgi:hypothetical protein
MFLVNPEDQTNLELLSQLFPLGNLSTYESQVGKDFYVYVVPPAANIAEGISAIGGTSPP